MSVKRYSVRVRSPVRTLVSIDRFELFENEITFLFGESGIGKSVISKAVYGLLDPDELDVEINSRPYLRYLAMEENARIKENGFFVFQEPSSHLNPLIKISDQIREGSLARSKGEREILKSLWQSSDESLINRVIDVYPKPYRPSGGEKQRILLAMAFKKIELLFTSGNRGLQAFFVFDEPTGSLDDNYRNVFLSLLLDAYERRPFTILFITHDYSIISEIHRSHRHVMDRVHFSELGRAGDAAVEQHDFSPENYLTWLQKASFGRDIGSQSEEVLSVDHSFEIFGRRLNIYTDEGRDRPGNLVIRSGEWAYLKAASGVGKTTLAKIVMGLYEPHKFGMTLSGIRVDERTSGRVWRERIWGRKAGMVFQHADEAMNLQSRVRDVFKGLPLRQPMNEDSVRRTIGELFDGEITRSFLNKKIAFLSGGQKQRLNILRTLALHTDLIILDEPLNGLDFESIRKVFELLEEKRRAGSAILLISHNEEIFDAVVDRENIYYLASDPSFRDSI